MRNAFTVELEDWYCATALERIIPCNEWSRCESRIVASTRLLLDLLDAHRTTATFFVNGYVAEREQELIGEIADRGHEIATLGRDDRALEDPTPDRFARDLDRTLEVIERATGVTSGGYRAPGFGLTPRTVDRAVAIIRSRGLWYDSSIVPTGRHAAHGFPGAPLHIHQHRNGLVEIPVSCVEILGRRVPVAGGRLFRQLPYAVSSTLMHRVVRTLRPIIFTVRPWELDPDSPLDRTAPHHHRRAHVGRDDMLEKLERMLREFTFTSIRSMLYREGYDRIERAELLGCGEEV